MKKLVAQLLLIGLLGSAASAQPETAPPPDTQPPPRAEEEDEGPFQWRIYQSTSYNINFNDPSDGLNRFRTYDFEDRKLKFDLLNVDLRYNLGNEGPGGRIDMTMGQTHPRIDAATGLFRNTFTGVSDTGFDLRQIFSSYQWENGIRADLGKFATHIGYEVMDGVDGANPNATRSWAFLYGPFTHTGLRVSAPVTDQVTVTGLIVTGWDQFKDLNSSPSFGAQIGVTPTDNASFYINYINGPELLANDTDRRSLIDFVGNWKVHDRVNLGINALYGSQQNFVAPGVAGTWSGVVLYTQAELAEQFNLNFRYEWFNDPDGTRTGVPQHLRGFTITPEYRFNENVMLRADLRFDRSDVPAFDAAGAAVNYQNTLMLNNVVRF